MTETSSLAAALAKVQGQLTAVRKDKTAQVRSEKGSYSYGYADLASVQDAVFPLMAAEGLAWVTCPTYDDAGRYVLAYTLMHGPSSETIQGSYPLPDPTRGTPQQIGSAITYGRRYCLSAVVGVATEDDDGKAASDGAAPKPGRRVSPAAKHDRELRGQGSSDPAERGAVPPDEDPFAAPEWAVPFRTRLAKAMTPEALEDRWTELQAAVANGEVTPEWGQTLKGEIAARKAHLEAEDAKPEAGAA